MFVTNHGAAAHDVSNRLAGALHTAALGGRLNPWRAPWLAEGLAIRYSVPIAGLTDACDRGLLERARTAVAGSIEGRVAFIDDPAELDVRALIEVAAKAADLAPSEIVSIVRELAPDACAQDEAISPDLLTRWAESALADFQRIPARLRLATVDGEYVEPELEPEVAGQNPANDTRPIGDALADFIDYLRERPDYLDTLDLQRHLTRERLGMAHPKRNASNGGLAYVDFDPSNDTPPPAWLAKGLLPRAGIGLLFGESGAGKSFAAIHSALSIAWGLPLFGARVSQGAVLYIAAEGGKSVLRRFKAADRELAAAVAAANLGRPADTAPLSRAPIRVVHEAPDLSRDGNTRPLVDTIRDARAEFERGGHRLALVIVDTWHAAMGGGDENSAADAGHALKPLIAESEAGDFLTMIVHHPGKDSDRGARGSNALPAAADAVIAISVPGHEGAKAKPSTALRRAVVTKMRDGEAGQEFAYRLPVVEVGVDGDGEPVTTCVVRPWNEPPVDEDGLTAIDREFMAAVRCAISEAGGARVAVQSARLIFNAARREAKANVKDDALRVSWSRAFKAAIEAGRVATDPDDVLIWLSDHQ